MRHGHHALHAFEPWLIVIGALAFIGVVVIVVWFVQRRTVASDGLTPAERRGLPYPQREILSMLRQHGGPMTQSEVADVMPVDPEFLAESLKSMELQGTIHRRWEPRESAYIVSTPGRATSEGQGQAASHAN